MPTYLRDYQDPTVASLDWGIRNHGYPVAEWDPDPLTLDELIDSLRGTPWMKHGLCRGEDTNLFFPARTERGPNAHGRLAKSICARCPVMEECREYSLAQNSYLKGIWGGLSERERETIRAQRRRTQRQAGRQVEGETAEGRCA